ncbi:hypothetical protein PIB30_065447 [Stylosanthes scabra]|uniref:Uncharacterized protein n=1 Tax=Stylosanthes scabra TaxID=79078 RepID=A0ABU6VNV2_9FABA|nr:hypothetical protein [Stylosanthes scabra]
MSAVPRTMDVDADEDYLQYSEEIRRHPEYSSVHISQAFTQHSSDDVRSQSSDSHSQLSYDLFGIWLPPVGPSSVDVPKIGMLQVGGINPVPKFLGYLLIRRTKVFGRRIIHHIRLVKVHSSLAKD